MEVMGAGDAACQRVIEKRPSISRSRTVNAAIVGCVWSGVCSPQIYNYAERLVGPAKDLRAVTLKMIVTTAILSTGGNYLNMRSLHADHRNVCTGANTMRASPPFARQLPSLARGRLQGARESVQRDQRALC